MRFSLRYTIPLALFIFSIVLALWSINTNGRLAETRVEKEMTSKLINILTLIQDDVEHGFRTNNLERIQQELSSFSSYDYLKNLSLIDEAGKIIAGTQYSSIGHYMESLISEHERGEMRKRIAVVKEKYSGMVFPSPDYNTLWGIYPVQVGVKVGDIRPTRIGVLIAQMDLVNPHAFALSVVKNQVFQFVFFLGVMVVGLGIFLHYQMTRRIEDLVIAAEKFAKGNFDAQIDVRGRDEITDLAKSMAEMAKKRKQVEQDLMETEEENSSIITSAMDGIISIDSNGVVRSLNLSAERLFGYKMEELIGESITVLMPEPYKSEHSNYIQSYIRTGEKKVIGLLSEVKGKRKDGSIFPLEVSISEVHKDGHPIFVGIVRDIGERKKTENYLGRYSSELKMANEELEKFVYTASHDLQEPLRKVIIFGDRLKETCSKKLEEHETDNIHRMQKAAFRMQDLINDLLGYSKLRFKVDSFESVDLNKLATEVIDDLEAQILLSKGIIQINQLPVVEGDKIQLRQLFQNLLSNSLKYAKPNVPPNILINYTAMDNNHYEISFLDNGIGFDEKYINKVFEPFQRLSANKDIQGTGMGMFICKKIVERHKGTITPKSTPDDGTTFIITLPKKQST